MSARPGHHRADIRSADARPWATTTGHCYYDGVLRARACDVIAYPGQRHVHRQDHHERGEYQYAATHDGAAHEDPAPEDPAPEDPANECSYFDHQGHRNLRPTAGDGHCLGDRQGDSGAENLDAAVPFAVRNVDRFGSDRLPGGDDQFMTLGPEYAAQGPDGTWYVLDAAKRRIARLGPTGTYLGAVAVPPSLLAGGYFQYQLPRVLADGTLIAESQVGVLTRLLRVKGNAISGVMTSTAVVITADDGAVLYGFDMDNHPVAVNPATGAVTTTSWFRTRAGNRYRITPGGREDHHRASGLLLVASRS